MALHLRNISFSYGAHRVLNDVSLHIRRNRFTVLLGQNGSGKSTLFKLIAGILSPDAGTLTIMGTDAGGLSVRDRSRRIGFLPQHHRPVFPFSVEDVVLTGRAGHIRLTPTPEDRGRAANAIEKTGISHLRGRAFTDLSGGEQQLVMIARVLAQHPDIILLDEPTSHLDFVNANRFMGLVKTLVGEGFTVIAVLHDPNLAFLYADAFIYLKDGAVRTLDDGTVPWDREVLKQVYDTDIQTVPYGDRALVVPLVPQS